jgi:hypothetical protein
MSGHLHATRKRLAAQTHAQADIDAALETATWRLLRAETSCNTYWGEAWVERAEADLMAARAALKEAESAAAQLRAASAAQEPSTWNSDSQARAPLASNSPGTDPPDPDPADSDHPNSDSESSHSAHSPETSP